MALPILDGNQSATTLSSILTSGEHIPAHTVVSLGTQAITDISGAVSGSVVSISNFPATQPVSIASVTIGNSVTIGSLPAISGTVTANVGSILGFNEIYLADADNDTRFSSSYPFPISGTVTVGNSVTIASLPAISGTVTANASFASTTATYPSQIVAIGYKDEINTGNITPVTNDGDGGLPVFLGGISVEGNNNAILPTWLDGQEALNVPIAGTVTIGNSVTIASLPAISGTVTANSSNGSLTTRFGSVTTANTAFVTSAVTNADRKYLLIQNVTTASNVITVGIGFTPTTTQGIQLSAGAGLTFEGNYIPTGAVNLLSSVTASCFTILEG
jgi:hypothetical protein